MIRGEEVYVGMVIPTSARREQEEKTQQVLQQNVVGGGVCQRWCAAGGSA